MPQNTFLSYEDVLNNKVMKAVLRQILKGRSVNKIENVSGWCGHTFIIDNQLVVKFPLDQRTQKGLEAEASVLHGINGTLKSKGFQVPDMQAGSLLVSEVPLLSKQTTGPQDELFFVVYDKLSGSPLSKTKFDKLDAPRREKVLTRIGSFLATLHEIPLEDIRAWGGQSGQEVVAQNIQTVLYDEPASITERIKETVFDGAGFEKYPLVFCHADLHLGNVLLNDELTDISGVIDFGNAMIAPRIGDVPQLHCAGCDFEIIEDAYQKQCGCKLKTEEQEKSVPFFDYRFLSSFARKAAGKM